MQIEDSAESESSATADRTDLSKRAVRALTEKMTVLPDTGRAKGADDLYLVVSQSGSEYLVDVRESRCDCPDAVHNLDATEQCKHERRVGYASGEIPIPEWVNVGAIDSQIGVHTEMNLVRAATDGGISADKCDCAKLSDNFPCWPCVRDNKKELPE